MSGAAASAVFRRSRDLLVAHGDLRLWSVIVSIFGDLAEGPEDEISGACLQHLTGLMELRPEALRVALHRLRKEGWIDSRRTGRESRHRLTARARAESLAARGRIYGPAPADPGEWHLHLLPPADAARRAARVAGLVAAGHLALAPGAVLGPGPAGDCGDGDGTDLILSGDIAALPGWLHDQTAPPAQRAAWEGLHRLLQALPAGDLARARLPAPERAALRVLIVHHWRRVLLRDPALPAAFFPPGWPAEPCRKRVHALLAALPRPRLTELHAALAEERA